MRVTGIVRCVLVCIMCIFTSALALAAGEVEGCRREEREALVSLQRTLEPLQIDARFAESYPTVMPVWAQWPAGGDGDCCEWQGVSCNADGKVEVLALNYYGNADSYHIVCSGTSPALPSLSSLQSLRVLDLARGYCFSGGIPAAWRSSFRNLTHLDLSHNLLNIWQSTGPWYSSLPNTLTYLNLNNTGSFQLDDAGYIHYSVLDLSQLLSHMPHLTHLDLSSNFLGSPLTATDHKALTDSLLRYLDLSENYFSGRIPEGLGSLQRLAYLDLNSNLFSGRIPEGLGSLQRLAYLDLSWNLFSGRIPEWLGSLQRLAYLDLSWNQFQNPVPWQHLGNLSNLQHLSLGNGIPDFDRKVETLLWDVIPSSTGLGEAGPGGKQCNWLKLQSLMCNNVGFRTSSSAFCLDDPAITSRLTDLSLSGSPTMTSINFLFHTLLPNASSLESLSLQSIYLITKLPLLPPLPFLKSLSIYHNNFLTEFPSWLEQRPPPLLESLLIYLNPNLTGPIPLWVSELPNLKFLIMEGNSLVGPIPPSLTNLSKLLVLALARNNLDVGHMPNFPKSLRICDLYGNKLSSNLSPVRPNALQHLDINFQSLENLEHLDLGSNLLTGPLPVGGLGSLKRLRYMDLSSNSFTGSLPDNMVENWTLSLVSFDLSGNNLTSSIPSSFSHGRHLLHLDLSNNQLTGNIPSSLGNARQVQYLNLSNNQLTGCIPSSLGQIGQFQSRYLLGIVWISLSHNHLSCDFPSSLACENLQVLTLSFNKLTGIIPTTTIQNCSSLTVLDLSNNLLCGEQTLAWMANNTFPQLQVLKLSNNQLEGKIPSSLIHSLASIQILTLSKNHLSGTIPTNLDYLKAMKFPRNDSS